MLPRFIVAEISKNWVLGEPLSRETLSELFERALAYNLARGYILYDFRLDRFNVSPDQLNETIIAVFEREQLGGPGA